MTSTAVNFVNRLKLNLTCKFICSIYSLTMSFIFKFFHSSILSNSCSLLLFHITAHRFDSKSSASSLLLPWQHLSKTCLHLDLCCCIWMFHSQTSRPIRCCPASVHQEDCRPSLTSDRWLSLSSQSSLQADWWLMMSLIRAASSLIVLASAPLTLTRKSSQVSRHAIKYTCHFHLQVNSSLRHASKWTVDFYSQFTSNVLSKCTPKNVLSKCTVKFIS